VSKSQQIGHLRNRSDRFDDDATLAPPRRSGTENVRFGHRQMGENTKPKNLREGAFMKIRENFPVARMELTA
jgi:hypothetical protein